ncbi:MAG: hypothetical protein KME59_21305 [Trichormus sp. ATA11-4-KO1]|jgi:hypothetical protein|nr:hypothetical protein [Trichormus sp. ATA11-4-KO1]
MIVSPDRLYRVLEHLDSALAELQEASVESPTDRTLRRVITIVITALAVLRFYVATN